MLYLLPGLHMFCLCNLVFTMNIIIRYSSFDIFLGDCVDNTEKKPRKRTNSECVVDI